MNQTKLCFSENVKLLFSVSIFRGRVRVRQ